MHAMTPANPYAPKRLPVGLALTFAVFGAPLAWSLQLVFGYALAAHACFPINVPLAAPVWAGLWWILIGIDIAAIVIAGGALATAWRCHVHWRAAEQCSIGERRNRYIAKWSVWISTLFSIAVLFTIVMLLINPGCGR